MPAYKKAYHILCSAASHALDLLPETDNNAPVRETLQKALYEAEELYIETSGAEADDSNSLPSEIR